MAEGIFDSVETGAVLQSLENARIDTRYKNIIKNIYEYVKHFKKHWKTRRKKKSF